MNESREAHLLTASIKISVENDITQATSESAKVVYMSASMTQLVTPGAGGILDAMHQALNMGDQNIGVLYQTLTVLCDVFGTLEQKMHHLSQNGTSQLIGISLTDAPRNYFEVRLTTFTAELDGVRKLTEGCGFNTVLVALKYLADITVWVQANLPSDTPKFEHFIDLDVLLAVISRQE